MGRKLAATLVAAVVCAVLLPFLAAHAASQLTATAVRVGNHGDHTSFVVDLSGKAAFSVYTQTGPDRVVIELPAVEWGAPSQSVEPVGGLVRGYRFGFFSPEAARIILDLSRPAEVRKSFMLPPEGNSGWRLVINLADAPRDAAPRDAASNARSPWQEPKLPAAQPQPQQQQALTVRQPVSVASPVKAPPPAKAFPAPRAKDTPRRVPTIAIDPGHGGEDPGATSVGGVFEKHITLAMALLLRDKLESEGRYRVILTRDRDVFISLRDRVAVARAAGAELFISLHADAIASAQVRGLSVYTLSEKSSDTEAAALAERENKVDLIAGVDLSHESPEVTNILINLAQRETMNLSALFSATAILELRREVRLLPKSHRFAGFAVLKAPDIPSVLVEMGYLSNADEESLLRQPAYRAKLTGALARAVDDFFKPSKKSARP